MSDQSSSDLGPGQKLSLTAKIVASYLQNNEIPAGDIPSLISSVHESLQKIENPNTMIAPATNKPAVPINKSISDDYLVCLEDGKKLKMLKRYIRSRFGLSPDDYRQKWGLSADYPMVAPAYSRKRSAFAKDIGLGKGVGRKKKVRKS